MTWGAIAVAAGTAIAGYVSADASKDAAKSQVKGANAGINETRREYDLARSDLAPYRQTGSRALDVLSQQLGLGSSGPMLSYEDWIKGNPDVSQFAPQAAASGPTGSKSVRDYARSTAEIGDFLGIDPFGSKKKKKKKAAAAAAQANADMETARRAGYDAYVRDYNSMHAQAPEGTAGDLLRDFSVDDFEKDPGYQFRMDEGEKTIERGAAARTGVLNGRAAKELARFGQDYASGEYSNAYNRFNNDRTTRFNRLAALAGVGQTATNTGVGAGANSAANIADLTVGAANARAAGRVGQANALNQGVQTLGNLYLQRQYGSSAPKSIPSPQTNYQPLTTAEWGDIQRGFD